MTEATKKQIESIAAGVTGLADAIQKLFDEGRNRYDAITDPEQKKATALLCNDLSEAQDTLLLAKDQLETIGTTTPGPAEPKHALQKYMVLCRSEGEQWTKFFDRLDEAEQYRMDAVCGIGAYAELYQRDDNDTAYDLMYA